MIVMLYRDVLCLASTARHEKMYTIQACIRLADTSIVGADNGQGLQCHTAPYSWKLVFECDSKLYEIIMTACSPKEETEWRSGLGRSDEATPDNEDSGSYSFLALDVKSLGPAFGNPGTLARRSSIRRAATLGPHSPRQVILRNTWDSKDAPTTLPNAPIGRSRSLLSTAARVPILAPSRSERARLEALLSDVWTRDVLPFPGMPSRSRSSASAVMRKLSVASITGSFSRRSSSTSSTFKAVDESSRSTTPTTTDQDSMEAYDDLKLSQSSFSEEDSSKGADLDAATKESIEPASLPEDGIQSSVQTMSPASSRITQPMVGPVSSAPKKLQNINRYASSASTPEATSRPMLRRNRPSSIHTGITNMLAVEKEQLSLVHATSQAATRKHGRAWDRVHAMREIFSR
jgi:hypothetical protein